MATRKDDLLVSNCHAARSIQRSATLIGVGLDTIFSPQFLPQKWFSKFDTTRCSDPRARVAVASIVCVRAFLTKRREIFCKEHGIAGDLVVLQRTPDAPAIRGAFERKSAHQTADRLPGIMCQEQEG
jgi:hypothetical protein